MRRFLTSLVLLFVLLSQSQVLGVYAQAQASLNEEKQQASRTIDAVEGLIDNTVEKIDAKISHDETKQKLKDKHEEIEEYLEEVQEDIQSEDNTQDIEKKVEQAKKVVVLKVVAGITPTEDIEDSIDSDVASTVSEKKQALEVAKDSLETSSGDYSIIVRTKYTKAKVIDLFAKFDDTTKVSFLYEVSGENYFEVFLREDSIFRQEMMEDIDKGILPESFLGIKIVLPEVFSVFSSPLAGENLAATWGIERYKAYNFLESSSGASANISVGVVDTGIDYTHSDLSGAVDQATGKDFVNDDDDAMDDQGHGTHVAGTIAAQLNGAGVLGVNPDVQLVPLKICTSSGFCPSYAVIRALEYASEQDIDILNMSLGGRGNPSDHAICAAIDAYTQNGGLVVAAAGNSDIDTSLFVPGGCSSSLSVAAIDQSGARAGFSNFGSKVDVAAPGVGIYSTYPVSKGSYKQLSGTSMAAPHVAGLVSMMLALDGEMTLSQAKSQLRAFPQAVSSDSSHKTIASAVDVPALLSSYLGTEIQELDEQEPEQAAEVETPAETQGQGANIAEYIENFSEDVAQENEIPASHHHPLDDLTLEDVSFEIQSDDVANFVPEVFNLNPTIQLDQIEINSSEQDSVYKNENSQNFSITDEAETGSSTGAFEPIPVPEVIFEEPSREAVQKIKLDPDFEIPGLQDGVEINSSAEAVEIAEVVEGSTQHSQSVDATDAVPADTGSIDIQNADELPAELAQTPDPESFTFVINAEDSGTGSLEPLSDAELEEVGEENFLTDEEHLQLEEDAGVGLQSAIYYSCDIYEGQRCYFYLYNYVGAYRINNSNPDVVRLQSSRRALGINSGVPGSTSLAFYDSRNRLKYVIRVKVRAIPVIEDVTCEVKAKRECRLQFPDLEAGSNVTFKSTNQNRYLQPVYVGDTKEVVIPTYRLGINWGTVPIEVFNNGYKIANLTLSITPDVPEYDCTLLIGDTCQVKLRYNALYEFDHKTGGIVSGYSSGNSDTVHMTAQAGGDELTYLRIGSEYHAAIRTKVIPPEDITVPIETCDMWEVREGVECQVEIVGASMLDYTVTTSGVVGLSVQGNTLTIRAQKVGSTQISVKYGGVTIGTINASVQTNAESFICRLNLGKSCSVYLGSDANRMGFQQTQGGLVDLTLGGDENRYLNIKAKQTGNFRIYVWDGRYSLYKAQIEVIITEPSTGSCSILEGGRCDIQGRSDKFNYEVLKDGVQVGEYRKNGRRSGNPTYLDVVQESGNDNVVRTYAEGLRAGEVELHIYRRDFDNYYKQHILDIEVIEAPFEATSFCETRVNGSCTITLRNIGTDKYTIQVSEEGITEMTLKRDYLYMKGMNEGTFEILIRNNETGAVVHRGNVLIEGRYEVTVPRPQTKLSQTSITLDVGASQLIEITQGNSATAYRVVAEYPNIEVSQATSSGFTVKATSADHEYVKVYFIDKETEYATAKLSVQVNGESSGGSDGGDSGSGSTGTGSEAILFSNFVYDTTIQSNFQPIYFELSGNPSEVGVEIRGEQNFVQQESLEVSPDGQYLFALTKKDNFTHLDVVPYYKDAQGNIHYYNDLVAVEFSGVAIASDDSLSTASAGDEVYAYFMDLGVNERFSRKVSNFVDSLAEAILDQLAPVCRYYDDTLKPKCREGYKDGATAELEAVIEFVKSFPTTREQVRELINYLKKTYNAAVEYGQNLVENVGETYENARKYLGYIASNLAFLTDENEAYLKGFVGATIVFGSIGVGKLKIGDRIKRVVNKFSIVGKSTKTKTLLTGKGLTAIAKPVGFGEHGSAFDSSSLSAADKSLLQNAREVSGSNEQGLTGEDFLRAITGKESNVLNIGSTLGNRNADAYDGVSKTLYEVKNYRNLVGSSDSTHNGLEIMKDAELLLDGTQVKQAVWIFLDKGPNSATIDRLENAGIEYILIQ